jgi:hypothetical protein
MFLEIVVKMEPGSGLGTFLGLLQRSPGTYCVLTGLGNFETWTLAIRFSIAFFSLALFFPRHAFNTFTANCLRPTCGNESLSAITSSDPANLAISLGKSSAMRAIANKNQNFAWRTMNGIV